MLVLVFFLFTSVCVISDIEQRSGQIGVRFPEAVLSVEQIGDVTLWKQTEDVSVSFTGLDRKVALKLIDVWGDVEQIYPDCLADGAPLIREDTEGCMLSEAAAWRLFGGSEVVGMWVTLEDKEYMVRGILDLQEEILVRENRDTTYTFLEAERQSGEGTEKLRQMLTGAGVLLEDGAIVEVDTIAGILKALWLVPAFLLLGAGYRMGRQMCGERKLWLWAMRIAVAAAVVILLWHSWGFSKDFIPSKWSDFEFFRDLVRGQRENYRRYIEIGGVYKDRILFGQFKQLVIWDMAISIGAGVFLILPRPQHLTNHLKSVSISDRKWIRSAEAVYAQLNETDSANC